MTQSAAANNLTSDSEIEAIIAGKKPAWWQADIEVKGIERVELASGGTVIRIVICYASKTYTPFYQTMLEGITGSPSIQLAALASYKIPEHVYSRLN